MSNTSSTLISQPLAVLDRAATTVDSAISTPVRMGVSACLVGMPVRYNGGHTRSPLCLKVLSDVWQWQTFCPEVAGGFGTPRDAMRLIGDPEDPTLVFSRGDHKQSLNQQLTKSFDNIIDKCQHLDGYLLQHQSPSCGLYRVKVYQANGHPHPQRGQGLFAKYLQAHWPLLPIEEEGRLHDPALYENFLVRVYAYHRFRHQVLAKPSVYALVQFHSRYKFLLLAHNQAMYRQLGRLLANQDKLSVKTLCLRYQTGLMQALAKPANNNNHTNTLLHLVGYLKNTVPASVRRRLADTIMQYHQGHYPLATPLALLKHYIEIYGSDYIKHQYYFCPYPEQLTAPHWQAIRDRAI